MRIQFLNTVGIKAALISAMVCGVVACDSTTSGSTASSVEEGNSTPILSNVFSDHMVLQQGYEIPFWGRAGSGQKINLTFNGETKQAEADLVGNWRISFDEPDAMGPYQVKVETEDGQVQVLEDVLIGDVYLCSGQSNMEFPVSRALNPNREIPAADGSNIRLFQMPMRSFNAPQKSVTGDVSWEMASAKTVENFSAVCWFSAKELEKKSDTPIGLVQAAWGGTRIEAWMNEASLAETGLVSDELEMLQNYRETPKAAISKFGERLNTWWDSTFPSASKPWENASQSIDQAWKKAPETMGNYQAWGIEEIEEYKGLIWFQTELNLPEDYDGSAVDLSVGLTDERDYVWVNGEFVGSGYGWSGASVYEASAGLLKSGKNIITIAIENGWKAGGILDLSDSGVNWQQQNIGFENWQWQLIENGPSSMDRAPWETMNGLSGIHNGMVSPLDGLKFKAAFWYQGESNASNPEDYEQMLAGLIKGWRLMFTSDLPVVVIQLANYGNLPFEPVESGSSGVRDAQRRAALADENTGLVVTIDIGDRIDIHPANKQVVAQRVVESLGYLQTSDRKQLGDNAQPVRAYYSDDGIVAEFMNTQDGLRIYGGDNLSGVEYCTPLEGCRFVPASLEGQDSLRIPIDDKTQGARIRYAWADSPIPTLFEGDYVPVTPFELVVEDE